MENKKLLEKWPTPTLRVSYRPWPDHCQRTSWQTGYSVEVEIGVRVWVTCTTSVLLLKAYGPEQANQPWACTDPRPEPNQSWWGWCNGLHWPPSSFQAPYNYTGLHSRPDIMPVCCQHLPLKQPCRDTYRKNEGMERGIEWSTKRMKKEGKRKCPNEMGKNSKRQQVMG